MGNKAMSVYATRFSLSSPVTQRNGSSVEVEAEDDPGSWASPAARAFGEAVITSPARYVTL